MTAERRSVPGITLVTVVLALVVAWTAAARLNRPVLRDAEGDAGSLNAAIDKHPDMRIDLNTATAAELALLPGVGPKLAEGIVEDRSLNGPFQSISDLDRVKWVGPSVLQSIEPYVVVDGG